MTVDLSIRGAEGIARVAAEVRRLGADRTIVNEMVKEIRKAVPPIRKAIREHEIEVLPKRGGLGKWVAKGNVTSNVRRGADSAGVTLVQGRNSGKGKTVGGRKVRPRRSDMKAIDAGGTRHPLFGNRQKWYYQALPPSAFTDGVTDEGATEFRQAVVRAVDNATAKLL